ncbi:hypothetical protein LB503_007025 [Fusarium chuoi]|nr:hypothetical protein LB503_007025 [Fusarium chuoi]
MFQDLKVLHVLPNGAYSYLNCGLYRAPRSCRSTQRRHRYRILLHGLSIGQCNHHVGDPADLPRDYIASLLEVSSLTNRYGAGNDIAANPSQSIYCGQATLATYLFVICGINVFFIKIVKSGLEWDLTLIIGAAASN